LARSSRARDPMAPLRAFRRPERPARRRPSALAAPDRRLRRVDSSRCRGWSGSMAGDPSRPSAVPRHALAAHATGRRAAARCSIAPGARHRTRTVEPPGPERPRVQAESGSTPAVGRPSRVRVRQVRREPPPLPGGSCRWSWVSKAVVSTTTILGRREPASATHAKSPLDARSPPRGGMAPSDLQSPCRARRCSRMHHPPARPPRT
jgi:hypothetical protein